MIKITVILILGMWINVFGASFQEEGKKAMEYYVTIRTGTVNISSAATYEVTFDRAFDTSELVIITYLDKSLSSRHISDTVQYGNLSSTGFDVAIWYEVLGLLGTKTTGKVHWIVSEKGQSD